MLNPKPPSPSRSFLLRAWREPGASPSWRFLLEDVRSGQRLGFGSVAALLAFLEKEWSDANPATGPPGTGDDGDDKSP